MKLNGYRRAAGKRNGGLWSVALVSADAVVAVTKAAEGEYSAMTLAEGETPALYHCKEDEAAYTETVGADGVVTHELSITMERMDPTSAKAVNEILDASRESGIVAIIRTNNDTSILVGWSEWFKGRYPLRLHSTAGVTGRTLSDVSAETVVLRSVDADKAWAYTGTV
jgi:hypothetical protein